MCSLCTYFYINFINYLLYICGKLPSTCHSQAQDILVVQGKQIIHLGAIRQDQDKLCLAQKKI